MYQTKKYMLRIVKLKKSGNRLIFFLLMLFSTLLFFSTKILLKKPITLNQMVLVHPSLLEKKQLSNWKSHSSIEEMTVPQKTKKVLKSEKSTSTLFEFERNLSKGKKLFVSNLLCSISFIPIFLVALFLKQGGKVHISFQKSDF